MEIISSISGNTNIFWDTSKPNGQLKKETDLTLFRKYFPDFIFSDIRTSLEKTYNWLEKNYSDARK